MGKIEFDFYGEHYKFEIEKGTWRIFSGNDCVITICHASASTPTVNTLKLLVNCYKQGFNAGKADGYSDCQYEMRRVLGVTK